MSKATGMMARIVAYVAEHPGTSTADMRRDLGIDSHMGLLTYAKRTGRIYAAGHHKDTRYFLSETEAVAADERIREEAKQRREAHARDYEALTRTDAWKQQRRDDEQRVLEALEEAGRAGKSQGELRDVLSMAPNTTSAILHSMRRKSLICVEQEQMDCEVGTRMQNRWRLKRYEQKQAAPGAVAAPRTGTLDDPWGVGDAPRVVNAAECRPWAAAAVRSMEAA